MTSMPSKGVNSSQVPKTFQKVCCLILPANNLVWSLYIGQVRFIVQVKLVTDKQVFKWHVLFVNCIHTCVRTTNFQWQVFGFLTSTIVQQKIPEHHMQLLKLLCQIFFADPYTDEQNPYIANFFYDNCTWLGYYNPRSTTCLAQLYPTKIAIFNFSLPPPHSMLKV